MVYDRLPANSSSRLQPLDQRIIQNLKAYYKRQWLQFTLESYESDVDPQSKITIRLAIRWILRSWNNEVTNTTIYNCFRKSTLTSAPISLPTPLLPVVISELYDRVVQIGKIQDAMAISCFLNPADEEQEEDIGQPTADDILQEVIEGYLGVQGTPNNDEGDEEQAQPQYTSKDALRAMQVLIDCTEPAKDLPTQYIRSLESLETIFKGIQEQAKEQQTLDRWIT